MKPCYALLLLFLLGVSACSKKKDPEPTLEGVWKPHTYQSESFEIPSGKSLAINRSSAAAGTTYVFTKNVWVKSAPGRVTDSLKYVLNGNTFVATNTRNKVTERWTIAQLENDELVLSQVDTIQLSPLYFVRHQYCSR